MDSGARTRVGWDTGQDTGLDMDLDMGADMGADMGGPRTRGLGCGAGPCAPCQRGGVT